MIGVTMLGMRSVRSTDILPLAAVVSVDTAAAETWDTVRQERISHRAISSREIIVYGTQVLLLPHLTIIEMHGITILMSAMDVATLDTTDIVWSLLTTTSLIGEIVAGMITDRSIEGHTIIVIMCQ